MMKTDTLYKYMAAIQAQHPGVWGFTTPDVSGTQNNILFAVVDDKEMVFKFGDKELVEKNEAVSKLYNIRQIPVPRIVARNQNDLYFEEYEKIQGRSLFEAMKRGMQDEQVKQVYQDILVCFEKMSRIAPSYINSNLKSTVHEVAKINIRNVNGEKVAQIFKFLVYMMNIFGRKGLYHSDITPKNIIVDNKGHFLGFVDVDSVNICSKNFAFATMAAKYKEMGFNPSELLADYRTLTHDTIDANYVNKYINLVATGKHILWKLRRRDNGK